ncbi:hypothetical protein FIBSPDRAFT_383102 [Athelia psychrophila]|uniref:Uncharacterized protein n=1 Tax=Athelia psychrophila TaxID=1759441 RepID=A0A166NYP9_9AGAM|nr:hypothetical protein FIBSPDRAFT_383102 [Fibularhizoctonia sp. CBS 109695]
MGGRGESGARVHAIPYVVQAVSLPNISPRTSLPCSLCPLGPSVTCHCARRSDCSLATRGAWCSPLVDVSTLDGVTYDGGGLSGCWLEGGTSKRAARSQKAVQATWRREEAEGIGNGTWAGRNFFLGTRNIAALLEAVQATWRRVTRYKVGAAGKGGIGGSGGDRKRNLVGTQLFSGYEKYHRPIRSGASDVAAGNTV